MQPSTPPKASDHNMPDSHTFTIYSRDEEDKEAKIAALTAKVKALQKQITQRVRGYLMHSKGKGRQLLGYVSTKQEGVQTDLSQIQGKTQSQYSSPTVYNLEYTPSNSGQEFESYTIIRGVEVKSEDTNCDMSEPKRYELLGRLDNEKKSEVIQEVSHFSCIQNEEKCQKTWLGQREQFYRQERKKLMKEIKALRKRVQFQSEVAIYAKEALLLSEQQNYQFRLQLRALKQATKPNQELATCQISNQQQHNIFYQENSKLQQQVNKLQEELRLLKVDIELKVASFQYFLNFVGMGDSWRQQPQIIQSQLEKLKEIVFQISNCIPLIGDHQESYLFRPQNMGEVISALQRVYVYCCSIDRWQNQKHLQITAQKQKFVSLLQKIAVNSDPSMRESLAQQIKKQSQFRHYLTIFKAKERQQYRNETDAVDLVFSK